MPSAITFDIRRPWGGAVQTASVIGNIIPRIYGMRNGGSPPPIHFTHHMVVESGVDIRDGCSRVTNTSQLQFGMGDEIRIPPGGAAGSAAASQTKYAVVYVERLTSGQKRVYLCRDGVDWANNGLR